MIQTQHQFTLEFTAAADGRELGQRPVTPDFLPGVECLRGEMLRRHGRALPVPDDEVTMSPKFSACGAPNVDAVCFTANGDSVELPIGFFRSVAQPLRKAFMDEGTLEQGGLCTYRVLAYPRQPVPQAPQGRFTFSEEPVPVSFRETDLTPLLTRATRIPGGSSEDGAQALLVFLPERIVDEILTQTRGAGAVECGGNLVGTLHRDPARCVLALEITACLPARHTSATSLSLSFHEDTWEDAQSLIALRNDGSLHVGWSHSHPSRHWCGEACPLEQRLQCAKQIPFFSEDDRLLHRTVFPMAWHVALLANHADSGLTLSAYGWRRGCIEEIPLHLLDATRPHGARVTAAQP